MPEEKSEYKIAKYEGEQSTTNLALHSIEAIVNMANPRIFTATAKKLLFCLESGLPMSSAFTPGVYIVNDQVGGVEGKVIAAQIKRHPRYDYEILEHTDKTCKVRLWEKSKRTGEWVSLDYEYTFDEATKSGVTAKGLGTWKTHPKDHLFGACMRRIGTYFAGDLFSSPIYTPDEFDEVYNTTAAPSSPVPAQVEIPYTELIQKYGANTAGRIAVEAHKRGISWQQVAAEISPDLEQLWTRLVEKYGEDAIYKANDGKRPSNLEELAIVAAKLEGDVKA